MAATPTPPLSALPPRTEGMHVFFGEFDEEGVYFYQAYNNEIADWAIEHQRFGGAFIRLC